MSRLDQLEELDISNNLIGDVQGNKIIGNIGHYLASNFTIPQTTKLATNKRKIIISCWTNTQSSFSQ